MPRNTAETKISRRGLLTWGTLIALDVIVAIAGISSKVKSHKDTLKRKEGIPPEREFNELKDAITYATTFILPVLQKRVHPSQEGAIILKPVVILLRNPNFFVTETAYMVYEPEAKIIHKGEQSFLQLSSPFTPESYKFYTNDAGLGVYDAGKHKAIDRTSAYLYANHHELFDVEYPYNEESRYLESIGKIRLPDYKILPGAQFEMAEDGKLIIPVVPDNLFPQNQSL